MMTISTHLKTMFLFTLECMVPDTVMVLHVPGWFPVLNSFIHSFIKWDWGLNTALCALCAQEEVYLRFTPSSPEYTLVTEFP